MKVGVFLGNYKPEIGGGYTFVNDVTQAFFTVAAESHHHFMVFCTPEAATELQKLPLPSNVQITALKWRSKLGKIITTLKHVSPAFALLWRFPSPLERMAKRMGIEMVWFVGGFFDTLDIPYIANVWDLQHLTHPWFPEVSAKGVWDYRESFLARHLRRAARIITGTQAGKDELMLFYRLQEHRIRILPHPTPSFALQALQGNDKDLLKKFGLPENFLLYPAQFWPHKNHINLLLALDIVRKRSGEIPHLALVGSDKENKAHVLQYAAKLGLADHVHALGFVSVEELIALYRMARAMVYTSFSGPENLPPLEAFALRCPVVISDYPGSVEQLGNAALYFDPHHPEAIADAITKALSNSAETKERVEKGFIRSREWTGQHYVRGVFEMLDEFESERRCWP